ncbi:MAG TPA: HAD hydrolase family protein [Ktedonobacteraceae bacterium]|jgi:soluble P-type ATPase|nr:HAD hydrolase family protein [Ktedonosporobacter sp.]HZU67068.1 HAD hydrolase family protein [Ktedonobacteraceae bacterium]
MIRIDIPQRGSYELHHAVFDINGTLAVDGVPLVEVADRLETLSAHLSIHLLTAGSHGNLQEIEDVLGYPLQKINTGEDKVDYVKKLGPESVVAIGNGANDAGMLKIAAIGIAVLAGEGVASSALQAADVLVSSPIHAIELLLLPKRLIATLRN